MNILSNSWQTRGKWKGQPCDCRVSFLEGNSISSFYFNIMVNIAGLTIYESLSPFMQSQHPKSFFAIDSNNAMRCEMQHSNSADYANGQVTPFSRRLLEENKPQWYIRRGAYSILLNEKGVSILRPQDPAVHSTNKCRVHRQLNTLRR